MYIMSIAVQLRIDNHMMQASCMMCDSDLALPAAAVQLVCVH